MIREVKWPLEWLHSPLAGCFLAVEIHFMPMIEHAVDGDLLVIHLRLERIIDEMDIRAMKDQMRELLEQETPKRVIVDFSHVESMSSSMLGSLVAFHRECKQSDIALRFCGIGSNILEVFKLTRLDSLFAIESDLDTARGSFEKKRGLFRR